MPPLRLDLEEFRDEIYKRIFDDGDTHQDIVTYLKNEEDITVTLRTVQRRCAEWGFVQRLRNIPPELTEAVRMSFFDSHLTDAEIAEELQDVGYRVSARRVKVVRLAQGWKRRTNTLEELQKQRDECVKALQDALAEGTIRGYGHSLLWAHLRRNHIRVRFNDMKEVIRSLDPINVRHRQPGMTTNTRGEYICEGPDEVWSFDGYDKLKRWGINIYGAIDAYSRRLLWVYTGISNRTQVSVAVQFCNAVRFHNKFPRIIRSDRGAETSIVADIQYDLGVLDMSEKNISPTDENGEALDEWPLREFYVYGTSTKNIRIESWWRQLRRGQTGNWQVSSSRVLNVRHS
jgi:hypothetical protein